MEKEHKIDKFLSVTAAVNMITDYTSGIKTRCDFPPASTNLDAFREPKRSPKPPKRRRKKRRNRK